MAGPFDSAWRKWDWAARYAEALQSDIERFASDTEADPSVTVRAEYNPKRHAFVLLVDTVNALPPEWSLRLGDIAFNWRSALDHLAWAVVSRGNAPPVGNPAYSDIGFPISKSDVKFQGALAKKLPGTLPQDIALIRRYQPYRRTPPRLVPLHALSVLALLNNHDKHRQIQPVPIYPRSAECEVTESRDCVVTTPRTRLPVRPVQLDQELGTVRVRRAGPEPHLKVEIRLASQITLENKVPVINWMNKTSFWIGSLLQSFDDPPPDIAVDPSWP